MPSLKIKSSASALLTVTRSPLWTRRMVYILTTPDKSHRYSSGRRSHIVYIGTTGKGAHRPAASAVNKASEAFGNLRGVKTIEAHIATCKPIRNVRTWKVLEAALLDAFRTRYFQLPRYNKIKPKVKDGYFKRRTLEKLIEKYEG